MTFGRLRKFWEKNKQALNALKTIFPVPDGDTGTNMSLTMMAAIKEMQGTNANTVAQVADAISKGSLKGARGNSGVILSHVIQGIFQGITRQRKDVYPVCNSLTRGCKNLLIKL